jgi:hypothetical protein
MTLISLPCRCASASACRPCCLRVLLGGKTRRRIDHDLFGHGLELAARLRQLDQGLETREQFDRADALCDEVRRAAFLGTIARRLVLVAGNHDDRQLADAGDVRFAHALEEPVAVQLGHGEVGNQHLHARIEHQGLPAGLSIAFFPHIESPLDVLDDGRAHHARIVDDEYARQRGGDGFVHGQGISRRNRPRRARAPGP